MNEMCPPPLASTAAPVSRLLAACAQLGGTRVPSCFCIVTPVKIVIVPLLMTPIRHDKKRYFRKKDMLLKEK